MVGLCQGAMVAAVAQLYLGSMTLFAARSLGSFGLRVAVVEPSAKTLGFEAQGLGLRALAVIG